LVKKYGRSDDKLLKTDVTDYYDVATLSAAKSQLLKDFSDIKQQVGVHSFPHIPQRRDGDSIGWSRS